MSERRLIAFSTLRKHCDWRKGGCEYHLYMERRKQACKPENCPVWKRLQKPLGLGDMVAVEREQLQEIQYQPDGPCEDMLCMGCFALRGEPCAPDCWLARAIGGDER